MMSIENSGCLPVEIENALIGGDLSKLSPPERIKYYMTVCESLGLNPLTKPFDYMVLNGKLVLYANRNCAEQLRKLKNVSITEMTQQIIGTDMLVVTVKGVDGQNRCDIASGAVSLSGLKGEALANAYLKCETKAKRRLTLSICSLGMLDETEVDSIPSAKKIEYSPEPAVELDSKPCRIKIGAVMKAALEESSKAGNIKPIATFTSDLFAILLPYYDVLAVAKEGDWKKKGEAIGKLFDASDDNDRVDIIESVKALADLLPPEEYSAA